MYRFNLWFFKDVLIVKNINELKKMQCKAALWITSTFQTSPSNGIEAIAGLIPITLHMCKLNSRHHLRYGSIPSSHAINSLLDSQHAKNHPLHKVAISKLTDKQRSNLKSPIKDVNKCLNGVRDYYNLLFSLFSPGSRVVDHFSSRFSFHSLPSLSNEDLFHYLWNLNQAFRSSQTSSHNITIIADGGIKKSQVATVVAYIWTDNSIIQHLQVNLINVTSIEAELMAIRLGLIPAIEKENIHDIIIITDSIATAKKIFESKTDPLHMFIPVTSAIDSFFRKDDRNKIQFWFCPSKAKWPKHKLVDNQVKADNHAPIFPSKELHLFNKKKECDNILYEWQDSFMTNPKRGQCFFDFEDENQKVIKPTYAKGSSWLPSIGFTNLLCACFTRMTTSHAPIREYQQRFFSHLPISCSCGEAEIQTQEHIVIECDIYDPSTCPCNIIINSFVHFLVDNPSAFSFDNG